MRRAWGIAVLILVPAWMGSAASSLGLTVGGGYSFDLQSASLPSVAASSQTITTNVPLAASLVADVGTAAMSVGISGEVLGNQSSTQMVSGTSIPVSSGATGQRLYFTASLFGRLPVPLGDLTLLPTLGIEGDFCVYAVDAQGNDLRASMTPAQIADLNEGWIKAGAALRVPMAGALALEPWILLDYQLPSIGRQNVLANITSAGLTPLFLPLRSEAGVTIAFLLSQPSAP